MNRLNRGLWRNAVVFTTEHERKTSRIKCSKTNPIDFFNYEILLGNGVNRFFEISDQGKSE